MNVRLPSPSTQPTETAGHRANGAWFGITEAAEVTDKSRSTIKKYLADGKFPQARRDRLHGQEAWVIPLGDLLAAGLRPMPRRAGTPPPNRLTSRARTVPRVLGWLSLRPSWLSSGSERNSPR